MYRRHFSPLRRLVPLAWNTSLYPAPPRPSWGPSSVLQAGAGLWGKERSLKPPTRTLRLPAPAAEGLPQLFYVPGPNAAGSRAAGATNDRSSSFS